MPKKIYVIASGNNSVNWDNTTTVIKHFSATFADDFKDYGAGNEAAVTCPGCHRELPLVLFHFDHIKSQARYAQSNLGLLSPNNLVVVDSALNRLNNARVQIVGGYVRIETGSIYNPRQGIIQSSQIWKNDLRNLQLLCSICNSSKRDRDWEAWGKADFETRPLSRIWKEQIMQA